MSKVPVLRSFRPRVRRRVSLDSFEETRTKQSDAHDADINNIMLKFGGVTVHNPNIVYGDYTAFPDLQEAMNNVIAGQQAFESLDANLRSYFHNDPLRFNDFMLDPSNGPEAIRLGLATARVAPPEALPVIPPKDEPQ